MTDGYPITAQLVIPRSLIHDLIETAGIGYWGKFERYPHLDEDSVTLYERVEEGDVFHADVEREYTLTFAQIARTLERAGAGEFDKDVPTLSETALDVIAWSQTEDGWGFDSEFCDVIIQLTAFDGEVVYG